MATSRIGTAAWTAATSLDGTELLAMEKSNNPYSVTPTILKNHTHLQYGEVSVTASDGVVTFYQCTADGSTDDRATLVTAFATAVANLPCVVEFGAGDYAISDGINIDVAPSGSGLTIKGQGPNTTKLSWEGGTSASSGYFFFKIEPTGTPSKTDPAAWLKNITIEGIGFKDNDPFLHQDRNGTITGTATGGSTTTLVVASAPFTAGAFDEVGGGTTHYIANETTGAVARVISNTTTTVTFDELLIGSRDTFINTDSYTISTLTQVEETHAISVKYSENVTIKDCTAVNVGDEAFNFTFVKRGSMTGLVTVGCPSISYSGGAITAQHGCEDIVISGCQLDGGASYDTVSIFDGSQGINIEALDTNFIENVSLSGNQIRNFGAEAINLSSVTSGTNISNVSITGNAVSNCYNGVGRLGQEPITNITVVGNTFKDITNYGINLDGDITKATGWVISDNTFDTCAVGGMQLNMSDSLLSNNTFIGCPRGIFIFDGLNINIASGLFVGCGGSSLEEIEDVSTTSSTSVSNITIKGSLTSAACVKGVYSLSNSVIEAQVSPTSPQTMVLDVPRVIGNTLAGGIACLNSYDGGIYSNNRIDYVPTSGAHDAINVKGACSNTVISGNSMDVSTGTSNSRCIDIDAGATYTLIVGNNLKSKTAGLANALLDDGDFTLADFTYSNIST